VSGGGRGGGPREGGRSREGVRVEVGPDVVFREVAGEAVLLDLATQRYYSLDETGTRMWSLLAEHGTLAAAAERLLAEYDVERHVLERDLRELVERLAEEGLVRLVPAGENAEE